jgi:hypothetical protein
VRATRQSPDPDMPRALRNLNVVSIQRNDRSHSP